jgi:hypothetical protein
MYHIAKCVTSSPNITIHIIFLMPLWCSTMPQLSPLDQYSYSPWYSLWDNTIFILGPSQKTIMPIVVLQPIFLYNLGLFAWTHQVSLEPVCSVLMAPCQLIEMYAMLVLSFISEGTSHYVLGFSSRPITCWWSWISWLRAPRLQVKMM